MPIAGHFAENIATTQNAEGDFLPLPEQGRVFRRAMQDDMEIAARFTAHEYELLRFGRDAFCVVQERFKRWPRHTSRRSEACYASSSCGVYLHVSTDLRRCSNPCRSPWEGNGPRSLVAMSECVERALGRPLGPATMVASVFMLAGLCQCPFLRSRQ